jgi:hypothetical protein
MSSGRGFQPHQDAPCGLPRGLLRPRRLSSTIWPQAAPGEAGRPVAMMSRAADGIKRGVQQLIERGRIDA